MPTKLSYFVRGISVILICAVVFAVLLAPQPASADGNREPVSGTITGSFYTAGCPSPIGQCGSGPVSGNLKGNFNAILDTVTPVIQNGQLTAFIFTGTATITANDGVLNANLTITDPIGGFLSGDMQFTGGTKRFKHADGMITFQQTQPDNGQTFQVFYQGSLLGDS